MTTAVDHELTFCASAAEWINQELQSRPELVFGRAAIEQSSRGSAKRRDVTIYDREGKIAVTIEVKLPYMVDGTTPFNQTVVEDAHSKAARAGARFFATWNVNRLVLWQTDDAGKPLFERHIWDTSITQVRDETDLTFPVVEEGIKRGLSKFLERASQAYTGASPLSKRPLDEFFITVLEAALERPIAATFIALARTCEQDTAFKSKLDAWMRDVQGWHLSDDELIQRDNLERAAKFTCYVLVNRIAFYHALRKRFTDLPALRVPAKLDSVADLRTRLGTFFERAMKVTRDYETVFRGDFGDSIPFVTDAAVAAWGDLLRSFDQFDFTQINYDVIGPIFEHLISPEERHRYGQHYTKPEIVDLIEAFCIRKSDATVLDPACGGGTFLVRAYNRKKVLAQRSGVRLSHEDLLNHLYGTDISAYAVHLTTINLATRDLVDEENYPLVAQSDFFDVRPGAVICQVPMAAGAGKQMRPVIIDEADAVVGNPPYVRQEEISTPPTSSLKGRERIAVKTLEHIKKEAAKYKKHLTDLARRAWPGADLSGRSDLHVYFWPHASMFLKPGGYFGFLTSSSWLDVEYGFRLQEFLLEHFAIVAIFESQVEPWFTGARVTTCATILRKEADPAKRDENLIRFVQLRSRLQDIFPANATEADRQYAVEALRDRIEAITANTVDRHWRVRVVRQGDLARAGRHQVAVVERSGEETAMSSCRVAPGSYVGGKWGLHLRAPDLFFELQERYGGRFAPMAQLAEVRFGVKSGCDKFFFVRDITTDCLGEELTPREFKRKYGILPVQADKVRIVLAGDDSLHLVEAEYLEPEVHNLMETNGVFGIRIDPAQLRLKVILCSKPRDYLRKTHLLKYIEWGEAEGCDTGSTVQQRVTDTREWYNLIPDRRGTIFWPKAQQYRHIAPINDRNLVCNCNLYDVFPQGGIDGQLMCAVLNSTVVAMNKFFFGRWAGTEGNLKTEVVDVNMMLVPDPRHAVPGVSKRIVAALHRMAERHTLNLPDEFVLEDRQDLDDAVFELLGETDADERRRLRDRLYAEMTTMHAAIREKELRMIENKKRTKGGAKVSVEKVAQEIWDSLDSSLLRRFPEDFINGAESDEIELGDGQIKLVSEPLLGRVGIQQDGTFTELGHEERVALVKAIHANGRRGRVKIPRSAATCTKVLSRYRAYLDQVQAEFAEQAARKTSNEKVQARIVVILKHRLARL
ncbi:MAG: N-6 DNA methylase [Planctomycetota bacterium]|nr:N-6 DNA methylase [Planctomycetota bacterium]